MFQFAGSSKVMLKQCSYLALLGTLLWGDASSHAQSATIAAARPTATAPSATSFSLPSPSAPAAEQVVNLGSGAIGVVLRWPGDKEDASFSLSSPGGKSTYVFKWAERGGEPGQYTLSCKSSWDIAAAKLLNVAVDRASGKMTLSWQDEPERVALAYYVLALCEWRALDSKGDVVRTFRPAPIGVKDSIDINRSSGKTPTSTARASDVTVATVYRGAAWIQVVPVLQKESGWESTWEPSTVADKPHLLVLKHAKLGMLKLECIFKEKDAVDIKWQQGPVIKSLQSMIEAEAMGSSIYDLNYKIRSYESQIVSLDSDIAEASASAKRASRNTDNYSGYGREYYVKREKQLREKRDLLATRLQTLTSVKSVSTNRAVLDAVSPLVVNLQVPIGDKMVSLATFKIHLVDRNTPTTRRARWSDD